MEIHCDGGCGKTQRVRARYIRSATWYICSHVCEMRLPAKSEQLVRILEFNAAGGFIGVTDRIAGAEERQSIERARMIRDLAFSQVEDLWRQ